MLDRFLLNDFDMTLATIVTSMENFLDPDTPLEGEDDMAMMDSSDDSDGEYLDNDNGASAMDDDSGHGADRQQEFEKDMMQVYRMFKKLQGVFEEKFKKMWA